jgi:hypothetical protein
MWGHFLGLGLAFTFDQPPVLPAIEASATYRIHLRGGSELGFGGHARVAYEQRTWGSQDLFGGCTGTSGGATGIDHLGALDLGAAAEFRSSSGHVLVQLWVGGHFAAGVGDVFYSDMDPRCAVPPPTKQSIVRTVPAAGVLVAVDLSSKPRPDQYRLSLFLHVHATTTIEDPMFVTYGYGAVTAGIAVRR